MSEDSQSNGLPIARSQQHARRALVYGRTLILLDVEAEHLDDVLDAVAEELATDPSTGYRDSVKESLRRLGDSGPELLDGGVAVVHDSVTAVDGVPVDVDVLVRTQEPLALRDDEGDAVRFIWVLITSEKTHPHVGAAAEFAHLMHHEDLAQPALAAETPSELAAAFEHALKREIDLTMRALVQEGIDDGSIKGTDARMITFTITGALNWIGRWYDPDGAIPAKEVVDGVVATLLAGLEA